MTIMITHYHIVGLLTLLMKASLLLKGGEGGAAADITADVRAIWRDYMIGVSPYVVAHVDNRPAYGPYWSFMAMSGVLGRIAANFEQIGAAVGDAGPSAAADQLRALIARRPEFHAPMVVEQNKMGECACGGRLISFVDSSERKCGACGATAAESGVLFDDVLVYSTEGPKPKQGRHYPSQHCKLWISRIQAWFAVEIPEAMAEQLRACCRRDGINTRKIACEKLREYFKECDMTKFNNHVPFVRKALFGIAPPDLTPDELDELYGLFNAVVEVLKVIRPDHNITYYPYIIYKILDAILAPGLRKAQILECIHLQSDKTMREVDSIWAQVCARVGLRPKPTNKHEHELLL